MRRNREDPEERGDAPAGSKKLSAVDGDEPTLKPASRQAHRVPVDEAAIPDLPPASPVTILVTPIAERPGYFTAQHAGCGVLIQVDSRTPFCDAARALLDAGLDPATTLVMRRAGSATESLRATIGTAARLTVEESAHGPVFRAYRNAAPSAVEAARVRPFNLSVPVTGG